MLNYRHQFAQQQMKLNFGDFYMKSYRRVGKVLFTCWILNHDFNLPSPSFIRHMWTCSRDLYIMSTESQVLQYSV